MAKTPGFKITQTIPDLIAESRKPRIQPETGWWNIGESEPLEILFNPEGGDWGNAGVLAGITHAPSSFYLDSAEGEVRLRGVIDGGVSGDIVFYLPPEACPEYRQEFSCAVIGGGTANVSVNVSGAVVVEFIN